MVRDRAARLTPRRLFLAGWLALACGVARADDVGVSPGPLPDIVQGAPSAPHLIVEYASMTCTHCAAFHDNVWPALKSKYVDAGRARFVLREFPLDPLAAAAFLLGRCAGDKRDALLDILFAQQKSWAFVEKPVDPLRAIYTGLGFSAQDFDACLHNNPLYDQVAQTGARAQAAFALRATPTFFVDGHKLVGEVTLADFDHAMEAAQ